MELGRFIDAVVANLERGDDAPLLDMLAPDAVVWHNYDRKVLDARESHEHAKELLSAMLRGVRVEVVRSDQLARGFLVQFVLRAEHAVSGAPVEMHNCLVATCDDDGHVTRTDEYVDPIVLSFGP